MGAVSGGPALGAMSRKDGVEREAAGRACQTARPKFRRIPPSADGRSPSPPRAVGVSPIEDKMERKTRDGISRIPALAPKAQGVHPGASLALGVFP